MHRFLSPNIQKLYAEGNVSELIKALRYKSMSERGKEILQRLRLIGPYRYENIPGQAEEALQKIGSAAVEPLLQELASKNLTRRGRAIGLLGHIRDRRAAQPLIEVLMDKDVQQAAITALGQIGDPCAVEPLVLVLRDLNYRIEDEDGLVERCVIHALGQIGDARAVEVLRYRIWARDERDHVRCARALISILERAAADIPQVDLLHLARTEDPRIGSYQVLLSWEKGWVDSEYIPIIMGLAKQELARRGIVLTD